MKISLSDLECVVIKVSVGIGRNFEEAERGLFKAKERKHENRIYNIEIYDGPPIESGADSYDSTVDSYLRLEQLLRGMGDPDRLNDLENLKYDPMTGLLNRTGYNVEVKRLKAACLYNDRSIILIDGDNMKQANSTLGYDGTDQYLDAIGRALSSQIRSIETPFSSARDTDILLNRKNGRGGDEFIVDLGCNTQQAKLIARRYIDAMYLAQLALSGKVLPSS